MRVPPEGQSWRERGLEYAVQSNLTQVKAAAWMDSAAVGVSVCGFARTKPESLAEW